MQSKPIVAITVLLLMIASLSVAGCTKSTQNTTSFVNYTVGYPGGYLEKRTFCENATLQALINNTSFELTKKFDNFSVPTPTIDYNGTFVQNTSLYQLYNATWLNNTTWRFSGDYFVIFSFRDYNAAANSVCQAELGDMWAIKNPSNFTNKSHFTVIFAKEHQEATGYERVPIGSSPYEDQHGIPEYRAWYDIIVVKYPEKSLVGHWMPELGFAKDSDVYEWAADHRI